MQHSTLEFQTMAISPEVRARWQNDRRLVADLRTDHTGETGAVFIYKGILAVSRDKNVREFAVAHLETERRHLRLIEDILLPEDRSALIALWKVAGWVTGALPAIFGPRAVFRTIEAVETFVDVHYQEQIDYLEESNSHTELRALLVACQQDEQHHRDEAADLAGRIGTQSNVLLRVWTWLVSHGSASAVKIARHL